MNRSDAGKLGWIASQKLRNLFLQQARDDYNANPKRCLKCSKSIDFEHRSGKFCNKSCAAKFNNAQRVKIECNIIESNTTKTFPPCEHCHHPLKKKTQTRFCSKMCRHRFEMTELYDVLLNGGIISHKRIKRYFKMTGQYKCMDPNCAWDFVKRPVDLEVDHDNGNAFDNHLRNLKLLCPNCHSLTPNYKNRNKGRGRTTRRRQHAIDGSYLIGRERLPHNGGVWTEIPRDQWND